MSQASERCPICGALACACTGTFRWSGEPLDVIRRPAIERRVDMALVRVELRPGVVFLYTQEEADNVVAANPDAKIVSSPGEKAVESAPATKERAKASNKTTTPATTSDEP